MMELACESQHTNLIQKLKVIGAGEASVVAVLHSEHPQEE